MGFNLETILTLSTLVTGGVLLGYRLSRGPRKPQVKRPWPVELSHAFFPVFLIVLVFRSFFFEPFRIPSGSMLPTLEIGDFILVKKFSYGLRLPMLRLKFWETGEPGRGDVVVFRFPSDPSQNYIKRLVGLPGDYVAYEDSRLFINGDEIEAVNFDPGEGNYSASLDGSSGWSYARESLDGVEHQILLHKGAHAYFDGEWKVPDGHYFMVGDNRDNSNDSRLWGFVPQANLVGRAGWIWLHWNWNTNDFDVSRIGRKIL